MALRRTQMVTATADGIIRLDVNDRVICYVYEKCCFHTQSTGDVRTVLLSVWVCAEKMDMLQEVLRSCTPPVSKESQS